MNLDPMLLFLAFIAIFFTIVIYLRRREPPDALSELGDWIVEHWLPIAISIIILLLIGAWIIPQI
jgi:integral membrane sensor domain MASE1